MSTETDGTPSERTLLNLIWERRRLLAGTVGAIVMLGAFYAILQPPRWESSATLVIRESSIVIVPEASGTFRPERHVADQVAMLESDVVASRTIEALEGSGYEPSLAAFRESRRIDSTADSNVVDVSYATDDSEISQLVVDNLVASYLEIATSQALTGLDEALSTIDQAMSDLQSDIDQVDSEIADAAAADPTDIDLEYQAALDRLVELQQSRPNLTEEEELAAFREELADLLTFLEAVRVVLSLDTGESPEVLNLLAERESLLERRNALAEQRSDLQFAAQFVGEPATVFSSAHPGEEVSGGPLQILLMSVILGLFFAVGLLLVLHTRDGESEE